MTTNMQQVSSDNLVVLRQAPPPPNNRQDTPGNFDTVRFEIFRDDNEFLMFEPEKDSNDDFSFAKMHEEFGKPILLAMSERRALRESVDKPLIVL